MEGSETSVLFLGCLRLKEEIKNKYIPDNEEENTARYFRESRFTKRRQGFIKNKDRGRGEVAEANLEMTRKKQIPEVRTIRKKEVRLKIKLCCPARKRRGVKAANSLELQRGEEVVENRFSWSC